MVAKRGGVNILTPPSLAGYRTAFPPLLLYNRDIRVERKGLAWNGGDVLAQKVLLVDDNAVILEMLQRRLLREGYQVLTCTESMRAVEMCREEAPDIVVLDILMPGKNGWEIMEELAADPALSSIPVIISTVKNRPEDVERGRELHAADYIAKPYVFSDLLEKIEKVLGRDVDQRE